MTEMQPNRVMYGKTLAELGDTYPNLIALDADLSKSTSTFHFQKKFPDRFFQVGIAEQNLVGIAAGLATTGLLPFASTFATFLSMRASEQIQTSIAYPTLNVKIVAVNAGVEIAGDGVTHQAIEDIAIMRAMPNMVVLSPADPVTTKKATIALAAYIGPVYMRLGRQDSQVIYDEAVEFQIGKMIRLREGNDLTIIATGNMVSQALIASDYLKGKGIQARVLDCHTIKPIDTAEIIRAAKETAGIVTAEDHNIIGGLGGAVCEVVANEAPTRVKRVGLNDCYASSGRDWQKLLAFFEIDSHAIVKKAMEIMGK
jgi:transketolase